MKKWTLHEQMLRNPLTDRMRDVHMLHHTQSVNMLDENSALRGNMPQRNDEEGGKQPRLSFSPAASVWGQIGRALTTDGRIAQHITETITERGYVAFFHQFFGLTNNPALAPLANVPCRCKRYFLEETIGDVMLISAAKVETGINARLREIMLLTGKERNPLRDKISHIEEHTNIKFVYRFR
jgi:hypothetical protein